MITSPHVDGLPTIAHRQQHAIGAKPQVNSGSGRPLDTQWHATALPMGDTNADTAGTG
jgi:hypothetical protein